MFTSAREGEEYRLSLIGVFGGRRGIAPGKTSALALFLLEGFMREQDNVWQLNKPKALPEKIHLCPGDHLNQYHWDSRPFLVIFFFLLNVFLFLILFLKIKWSAANKIILSHMSSRLAAWEMAFYCKHMMKFWPVVEPWHCYKVITLFPKLQKKRYYQLHALCFNP